MLELKICTMFEFHNKNTTLQRLQGQKLLVQREPWPVPGILPSFELCARPWSCQKRMKKLKVPLTLHILLHPLPSSLPLLPSYPPPTRLRLPSEKSASVACHQQSHGHHHKAQKFPSDNMNLKKFLEIFSLKSFKVKRITIQHPNS